jgi:predicted ATPase
MSREALGRAAVLAHPFTQYFALGVRNWLFQLRREAGPVQEQLDTVLRLSNEQQFALGIAMSTVQRGWTLVHSGRRAEGVEVLRKGLAEWRATGANLLVPFYLALLGEAADGAEGGAAEGLAATEEALAVAEATGERWYEAEIHRLRGEMLQHHALDASEAHAALDKALETARRQRSRALELRAAVSIGRWLHAQGDDIGAVRVVSETYRAFAEGADVPDLREARHLLDACDSRGREVRAYASAGRRDGR